jgi:hypothetical protein
LSLSEGVGEGEIVVDEEDSEELYEGEAVVESLTEDCGGGVLLVKNVTDEIGILAANVNVQHRMS